MTLSKLNQFSKRWKKATGKTIPYEIACLPLDRVEKAVEIVEAGDTVFIPTDVAVVVDVTTGGSMVDWDSRGEE